MLKRRTIPSVCAMLVLGIALRVGAQEAAPPPAAPAPASVSAPAVEAEPAAQLDPKVKQVLQDMSDYLSSQKCLVLRFTDTFDRLDDQGQLIQYSHQRTLSARRPDRLRFEIRGDVDNDDIVYDGKTLTAVKRNDKVYAQIPVPATIDEMLAMVRENYRIEFPTSDIIRSNLAESIFRAAESGHYVGLHKVGGVECHHIALMGRGIEGQLWIENSKTPIPRKFVIIYRNRVAEPRYSMVLESIETPETLPDTLFTFAPTPDLEKIDFHPAAKQKSEGTDAK